MQSIGTRTRCSAAGTPHDIFSTALQFHPFPKPVPRNSDAHGAGDLDEKPTLMTQSEIFLVLFAAYSAGTLIGLTWAFMFGRYFKK